MQYPKSYLVWDLETTGLDPKRDRILEVAFTSVVDGRVTSEYSAILNHDIEIPEEASRIHGITKEKTLLEGRNPAEVLDILVEEIDACQMMVTHNGIMFDRFFLMEELLRLGYHPLRVELIGKKMAEYHFDTAGFFKARKLGLEQQENESFADLAQRAFNVRAYGLKYNVKACCEDLGVDMTGIAQHRAMGDVILTQRIYKKLTE